MWKFRKMQDGNEFKVPFRYMDIGTVLSSISEEESKSINEIHPHVKMSDKSLFNSWSKQEDDMSDCLDRLYYILEWVNE